MNDVLSKSTLIFLFFKHVQFYILSDLLSSIVVCVIKYPEQILQSLYSC